MTIEEAKKKIAKANKGKADISEHNLQMKCVRYFRLKYKKYLIYAVPNGGYRTRTTAKKLVLEGVVSGVPDLFIAVARHDYHGLYIEMKNGKAGKVSKEQKEIMAYLENEGYKVALCRDLDEFMKVVDEYFS